MAMMAAMHHRTKERINTSSLVGRRFPAFALIRTRPQARVDRPCRRVVGWVERARPSTSRCVDCWVSQELDSLDLHVREQPVADVVDAELAVIDLAVLGAAVIGGEDLDVLAPGAHPLVELAS